MEERGKYPPQHWQKFFFGLLTNIYDEIMGFDEKWDTLVVENGSNLSGGQKQRIAIASALDKENQRIFFETINQLKGDKAILIIAHKYDDWKMFDNVFEVSGGEIRRL